jgi:hypothetical protein
MVISAECAPGIVKQRGHEQKVPVFTRQTMPRLKQVK